MTYSKSEKYGNIICEFFCVKWMKGCDHGYLGGLVSIHNKGSPVDESQKCMENYDGIIINAAGYTHYSMAIGDALEGNIPAGKFA